MKLITIFGKLSSIIEDPKRGIPGLIWWPRFSFASFIMLSRLTRQGIHPMTIVDLGANVGQFSVAAAKLISDARIYAFEPIPDCLESLKKNVSKIPNISVHPLAVGDTTGTIKINVNSDSQVSSILELSQARIRAFPKAKVERTVEVGITRVDDALNDIEWTKPVLFKIDVQGYEDKVLRGARQTLKYVDYVILELSFIPLYEGESTCVDMINLMLDFGFRFLRPLNWLVSPKNGEALEMDALFGRADVSFPVSRTIQK